MGCAMNLSFLLARLQEVTVSSKQRGRASSYYYDPRGQTRGSGRRQAFELLAGDAEAL